MLRTLRVVHAWAGLVLALVVAVIAASGTLLVFKADYLRVAFPQAGSPAPTTPAALAAVLESAQRRFPQQVRSVVFGTEAFGGHQVYLRDGGGAYLGTGGALLAHWPANGRPEAWLFSLHEELLGGETGHLVAGSVGLASAVLAVAGLVLWWPGARGFRGRLWPRTFTRRALIAQHRDLGAVAALPILLVTLTGAAMVFPAPAQTLLAAVLPGGPATRVPAAAVPPATPPAVAPDWARWLDLAQAQFPDATLRVVALAPQGERVTVRLRQPREWHPNGRTRVELAAADGAVLKVHDALRDAPAARAFDALYPLHAAKVGGRAYDVVVAASGLALTLLALLGGGSFAAWKFARRRAPAAGARSSVGASPSRGPRSAST